MDAAEEPDAGVSSRSRRGQYGYPPTPATAARRDLPDRDGRLLTTSSTSRSMFSAELTPVPPHGAWTAPSSGAARPVRLLECVLAVAVRARQGWPHPRWGRPPLPRFGTADEGCDVMGGSNAVLRPVDHRGRHVPLNGTGSRVQHDHRTGGTGHAPCSHNHTGPVPYDCRVKDFERRFRRARRHSRGHPNLRHIRNCRKLP